MTLPTFPVAETPVTLTLAIPVTVTLPTAPVAETPVTDTFTDNPPNDEKGEDAMGVSEKNIYTTVQTEPDGTVTVIPELIVIGPALKPL